MGDGGAMGVGICDLKGEFVTRLLDFRSLYEAEVRRGKGD
jgi:hypothetical protein